MVSTQQLKAIMPFATLGKITVFLDPLNATMEEFFINTRMRKAAFLAQLAHESGQFNYVEEIASGAAYDDRADLGNTKPEAIALAELSATSPGRYFKGRGLIQITGYANYKACSWGLLNSRALLDKPELLKTPELACRSAGWFWDEHELNTLADQGKFEKITRVINGGLTHIQQRRAFYAKALLVLPKDVP